MSVLGGKADSQPTSQKRREDPRRKWRRCFTEQTSSYVGLNDRFAERLPKINPCRTRLSPPTLHQHDNASTHHDKNDDDGKRLRQAQGLVPVVPKLKHALVSIQIAPGTEKIPPCRKHVPLRPMLRFVARGLIARQNDLCRASIEAARKCKNDR